MNKIDKVMQREEQVNATYLWWVSAVSHYHEQLSVTQAGSVWVRRIQLNPFFDSKFHFYGKFCLNLINLGYRMYHKYSYSYSLLYTLLQQVHFLPMTGWKKNAGWVAIRIDPDLRHLIWVYTICSGLPFRIRGVSTVIWRNRNPSEIILDPPLCQTTFYFLYLT